MSSSIDNYLYLNIIVYFQGTLVRNTWGYLLTVSSLCVTRYLLVVEVICTSVSRLTARLLGNNSKIFFLYCYLLIVKNSEYYAHLKYFRQVIVFAQYFLGFFHLFNLFQHTNCHVIISASLLFLYLLIVKDGGESIYSNKTKRMCVLPIQYTHMYAIYPPFYKLSLVDSEAFFFYIFFKFAHTFTTPLIPYLLSFYRVLAGIAVLNIIFFCMLVSRGFIELQKCSCSNQVYSSFMGL